MRLPETVGLFFLSFLLWRNNYILVTTVVITNRVYLIPSTSSERINVSRVYGLSSFKVSMETVLQGMDSYSKPVTQGSVFISTTK